MINKFGTYPQVGGLIGNLGGALSLWLGISLAMFLEIVEFIILIIMTLLRNCISSNKHVTKK